MNFAAATSGLLKQAGAGLNWLEPIFSISGMIHHPAGRGLNRDDLALV